MPFDGVTLASVLHEISPLVGGRIDKISQPEADEIFIGVRAGGVNHRLFLTANANAPRIGLATVSKASPLVAPMFCMVLRKHIGGGRIVSISQPDFERIVEIKIDALDEMGDRREKTLTIEIMGKHSNILLLADGRVVDAIKHVPFSVSAVRQILPGAAYLRPPSERFSPLATAKDKIFFEKIILEKKPSEENITLAQAVFRRHNGISPVLAAEICFRAGLDAEKIPQNMTDAEITRLHDAFCSVFDAVEKNDFSYAIYRNLGKPHDLAALPLQTYSHFEREEFPSPSAMFEAFYSRRDEVFRVAQKTADMRKLVNSLAERCRKKSFVFERTLEEIKDRDDLRVKGELLTAFLYQIPQGAKSFTAQNFYDENRPLEIPLDPALSPSENAQKFFKRYNKQKRAFAALAEQISKNNDDLAYLESVAVAMETAADEADIAEIRAELAEMGFVKRRGTKKGKKPAPSKPLKFTTEDGFEIFVGKNNTQNDLLTMKTARPHDIWFHTKDIAGSHVILVTGGREPSDAAIHEAAMLAAKNSRAKDSANVPVDFVAKKHVRKPAGAKPGYVIYDFYKTVYVTP